MMILIQLDFLMILNCAFWQGKPFFCMVLARTLPANFIAAGHLFPRRAEVSTTDEEMVRVVQADIHQTCRHLARCSWGATSMTLKMGCCGAVLFSMLMNIVGFAFPMTMASIRSNLSRITEGVSGWRTLVSTGVRHNSVVCCKECFSGM